MENADFLFSLYPKDLLLIQNKKPLKVKQRKSIVPNSGVQVYEGLFYYRGFDISDGRIKFSEHDQGDTLIRLGGKRIVRLEKYEVDVLGNYRPVRLPEKRMGFRK